jgi:hypothetical protein
MAVELFRSKAFIEGMEAAGSAAKPSVRCRVLFEAADKKVLGCSFDQDGCPVCRTLCSLWKRRQRDAKYQLLQDKGRVIFLYSAGDPPEYWRFCCCNWQRFLALIND